ncbi:uncharacterized protein EV420DRAFT_1480756 [Desarmillaria tabescens]|uniref:Uncharacterized protein n=1 Tax=Armillaria tabescens TaxID=1929756 RepID=A0AA39N4T2_ARMTA|nr:uncharacterized protein EV420DRAFT_1480756 [Desarmillaria tabescens]KAK0457280.1 hypothetical protein EV420DRAFT_1480756 [Desarmillaria tabescens]
MSTMVRIIINNSGMIHRGTLANHLARTKLNPTSRLGQDRLETRPSLNLRLCELVRAPPSYLGEISYRGRMVAGPRDLNCTVNGDAVINIDKDTTIWGHSSGGGRRREDSEAFFIFTSPSRKTVTNSFFRTYFMRILWGGCAAEPMVSTFIASSTTTQTFVMRKCNLAAYLGSMAVMVPHISRTLEQLGLDVPLCPLRIRLARDPINSPTCENKEKNPLAGKWLLEIYENACLQNA